TSQISALTVVGRNANRYQSAPGERVNFIWSDGTPTASTSTTAGLYLSRVGSRYELNVPADTTAKTLTLYAGGWKARGRLDISLGDASADPISIIIDNPNGVIDRVVTIDFIAASAGQSLFITYTLVDDYGVGGNITLSGAALAEAAGNPNQPPMLILPFTDNFDNIDNWGFVDETDLASNWVIINGELHQQNRVESVNAFDQSYHLGTFGHLSDGQTLSDYTMMVDAQYLSSDLAEDIGVMFRYQDSSNYYRLTLNSRYGFTRLEKKVSGQFTPLATNSRGYMADELLRIKIEMVGTSIKVYLNEDPLFAVTDSSLTSGTVALYTQDNAKFDNLRIEENAVLPSIVIASPVAHSVVPGSSLNVTALAINVPTNGYVEFVLNDTTSLIDTTPPFSQTFNSVGAGIHKVDAILRDEVDVEVARDTNIDVATQGDYIVAVGDSITNGIGDNYAADNLAKFGRIISFQGFEAPLTDKLNTNEAFANNLVVNEGIGGDESFDAAFVRIESILERHPETNQTLILLGTNDALSIIPSGLSCIGVTCDGTFKGNLQTLVDKVIWFDYPANTVSSNIMPVVSLIPPIWNSTDPWNSTTNNRIRDYNTVITTELSGITVGADLFSYFMPSFTQNYASLFADTLHPNGLGQDVISSLLYNALNLSSSMPLPFILDDLTVSTFSSPQQNLLEVGDQYYLDEAFSLASIPAALQDGRWIMSRNVDGTNTSASYLSFTVDQAVDVYIAYDNNAMTLPDWLLDFSETGLLLSTTDPSTPDLHLYKKSFPTGTITLGGNLQGSATGANSNYVTIIVEM
ncbi:hypothetical protein MNBD_GAMMA16-1403, partial [hydrothermal vent metagenome]